MSPVNRVNHSGGSLEIAGFCQTVDLFQFNSVFSLIHSFHLLFQVSLARLGADSGQRQLR